MIHFDELREGIKLELEWIRVFAKNNGIFKLVSETVSEVNRDRTIVVTLNDI